MLGDHLHERLVEHFGRLGRFRLGVHHRVVDVLRLHGFEQCGERSGVDLVAQLQDAVVLLGLQCG
jgi:hypothetical protein